jgi:hypothetical protein
MINQGGYFMRTKFSLVAFLTNVLFFNALFIFAANAQNVQISNNFSSRLTTHNVSGGLSHLPDGDILAFKSDYSNGPALTLIDANNDGFPVGGEQILKQFDNSVFADFVQVSPRGTFALAGIGGSSDMVYRIDLSTYEVTPYFNLPYNYDLTFIINEGEADATEAYVSSNPTFNPFDFLSSGPNVISLVRLGQTPQIIPVIEIPGTPSGPIAVNKHGDVYYIKGTYSYPAPAGSSTLLRFSSEDIAQAISSSTTLSEAQADASVALDGGFDMVFHSLGTNKGELFVSVFGDGVIIPTAIYRIPEDTFIPQLFVTVDDPTFPAITGLSFLNSNQLFDTEDSTNAELAAALTTDYFSANYLLQIHPVHNTGVDRGFCKSNDEVCLHRTLDSTACIGANGFFSQVNIASIINLRSTPLAVTVQYFASDGELVKQIKPEVPIGPNLKYDVIINDMGLAPDTIGTVCVSTDGERGSWTGGIAIYKPDFRQAGSANFGTAFDFALYYPFLNPFDGPVTVPLNTYYIDLSADAVSKPKAVVANWIAISDAKRDGQRLTGTLRYFNEAGQQISPDIEVKIEDGGRQDFPGHVGIGGLDNADAVGMAQFIPAIENGRPENFYLTNTRYFYDCPPNVPCSDFRTAFNLPFSPGTEQSTQGGTSTANGEISIVELNNVSAANALADVAVYSDGRIDQIPSVSVPARATHHLILNKVGQSGFLESDTPATTEVEIQSGVMSATSVFYKLDAAGKLEYAYAAPFTEPGGSAQISQFNSFIAQDDQPEIFNASNSDISVNVDFIASDGQKAIEGQAFTLPAKTTKRLSDLVLPPDIYGTVIIQGSASGLVGRNYVIRPNTYVLPFEAQ